VGRIIATLIRLVGDFDLAEKAAQEAFAVTVNPWETNAIPDLSRAQIIQTGQYKAIASQTSIQWMRLSFIIRLTPIQKFIYGFLGVLSVLNASTFLKHQAIY